MVSRSLVKVCTDRVSYCDGTIKSKFDYTSNKVVEVNSCNGIEVQCKEITETLEFKTKTQAGKLGVMMVGLGGNNGTTLSSAILANKNQMSWEADRKGTKTANWYGSMLESSTMRLGNDSTGQDYYVPLKSVVPLANANDVILGGWDIHESTMAESMHRSRVVPVDLQRQLKPHLEWTPLKGIFRETWIAGNQKERANWTKSGSISDMVQEVRREINQFKVENGLEKLIVFWTANTERFSAHIEGVHDTADNFLKAVESGHDEIAPSALYCLAAILEGCTFINGSPQNTICPALMELAERHQTFLGGNDLKTGQTKIKSVLVDWLVSSGLKVQSIASYNHLGNNDGLNLNEDAQFRSKEISKSDVVTDVINSNKILYKDGEKPDHLVVIKYMPYVGDSKRALDEYTSELILGGDNTIVLHNTCEDSLLAAPLMMDLILMAEFCERVTYRSAGGAYQKMFPVLSMLSCFLKAPIGMEGATCVNAFFSQRSAITNFFRIIVGLKPDDNLRLEDRVLVPGMSSHIKLHSMTKGSCGCGQPAESCEVNCNASQTPLTK
eukprot:GHVH01016706.1.p1 GENE.GHVH01016706.1~~GHVH01016706.1.p1  ORF type:complete len:554 (-),score=80.36 GHVH01016706.1:39-1700(-)